MSDFFDIFTEAVGEKRLGAVREDMRDALFEIAIDLYNENAPDNPEPPNVDDAVLKARYKDQLAAFEAFDHEDIIRQIASMVSVFLSQLSIEATNGPGHLVPAREAIPTITALLRHYSGYLRDVRFPALAARMQFNLDHKYDLLDGTPLDRLISLPVSVPR